MTMKYPEHRGKQAAEVIAIQNAPHESPFSGLRQGRLQANGLGLLPWRKQAG